ncbi:toxic anion resistance protein [Lactococcus piscium]|uniref:toxic anion resistance protein n=1 Tax=Pseudolactococcus carnosus TaxID=2749961 RepID=UPI0015DC4F51|nr:toxic anion resistance protein [Lactococcus carnosus]MCJ1975671.1 toxic anion resistance protein [Lactococcus carnosus]MCJ1985916.1 toxic anion resistance protein [Lactococcus carnosus]MCJ1987062.1 toxic anion resistance protein [Lactococcus carnosus]MCJ2004235.1 toxic anion resistance protein [Lactococcus carnosus]QDJ25907.1 tellurite resistance protein TelA [Lactococcus carnosus]
MANELLDELMLADQDKTLTDVTVQEAQVVSETQTPEATALATLTEEELGKAKALSKSLDENNAQSVIEYGALAQKKIGDFSQSVLNKVQTKDLGDVGSALTDLMYQLQESNPNDLAAEDPGFFKKMFGKVKKSIFEVTQKYQKLGAGIDKISIKLSHEYKGLLDDNKTLETLYAENLDFFHALSVYIAGAELKIKELSEITIPQVQKDAESMADNAIAVQKISDLENYKNRLDKRQYDLKLARQITIQQAPQIRMIQNTNQELAEKIQTSINTAIPLWKNQVAIALTLLKQKDALTSQRIVSNTTNDLLTKNSEMLKQSSIEAARENERGVVDIETLKKTQANLIETIQETMTIQREGAIKRRQGEVELSQLEAEIKAKLLALSNKEKSE